VVVNRVAYEEANRGDTWEKRGGWEAKETEAGEVHVPEGHPVGGAGAAKGIRSGEKEAVIGGGEEKAESKGKKPYITKIERTQLC